MDIKTERWLITRKVATISARDIHDMARRRARQELGISQTVGATSSLQPDGSIAIVFGDIVEEFNLLPIGT